MFRVWRVPWLVLPASETEGGIKCRWLRRVPGMSFSAVGFASGQNNLGWTLAKTHSPSWSGLESRHHAATAESAPRCHDVTAPQRSSAPQWCQRGVWCHIPMSDMHAPPANGVSGASRLQHRLGDLVSTLFVRQCQLTVHQTVSEMLDFCCLLSNCYRSSSCIKIRICFHIYNNEINSWHEI